MDLKLLFEQAAADSLNLTESPSNDTKLLLYSLYKQATQGDVNIAPPENMFDFVARAKYDAWASLKGKSMEQAMQEYIDLVAKLKS